MTQMFNGTFQFMNFTDKQREEFRIKVENDFYTRFYNLINKAAGARMRNSARKFIEKNKLTSVHEPDDFVTKFQPGAFWYIDMKGRIKKINQNDAGKTGYVLTLISQGRLYGRLIPPIVKEGLSSFVRGANVKVKSNE